MTASATTVAATAMETCAPARYSMYATTAKAGPPTGARRPGIMSGSIGAECSSVHPCVIPSVAPIDVPRVDVGTADIPGTTPPTGTSPPAATSASIVTTTSSIIIRAVTTHQQSCEEKSRKDQRPRNVQFLTANRFHFHFRVLIQPRANRGCEAIENLQGPRGKIGSEGARLGTSMSFGSNGNFAALLVKAYVFQQRDEARVGAQRVPVMIHLEVDQLRASFLVSLFQQAKCGVVLT
jgi:hypothetical protein